VFRAYMNFSKICVRHWVRKWQLAVLNGDIDIRYTPIGQDVYNMAKLDKRIMDHEFGIRIKLLPSDDEKNQLLMILNESRMSGQLGMDDYFQLERMVKAGQIDMAQLYAAKAIAEREARMQEMEIQRMKQNAEANTMAAQAAEQAKQQTLMAEAQKEIQVEQAIGEIKANLLRLEAQLRTEGKVAEIGAQIALDENK